MKGAEVDLEEQTAQPSSLELRVGQEGEGLARLEPYFCRQLSGLATLASHHRSAAGAQPSGHPASALLPHHMGGLRTLLSAVGLPRTLY